MSYTPWESEEELITAWWTWLNDLATKELRAQWGHIPLVREVR